MPVDEGVLARWAHELAAGVAAVHATSVAHRDLKARRSPLLVVVEDDRCLVAHAGGFDIPPVQRCIHGGDNNCGVYVVMSPTSSRRTCC